MGKSLGVLQDATFGRNKVKCYLPISRIKILFLMKLPIFREYFGEKVAIYFAFLGKCQNIISQT